MPSRRLAIWDIDGTLVDSREVIQTCMEAAFRETGLPPPDYDRTRKIVGLGLFEGCAVLAPPDIGRGQLDMLVMNYRNAFKSHRTSPGFRETLYDDAVETLEELRAEGWLMGIATGKSHNGLEALFATHPIRSFFDTVWCADDGPGKPHPFMIEQAMGAVGCHSGQSVMIGDAVHDIGMGRAAGVRTLGVSWGFGRADELDTAGADEIHHDFRSLRASLMALRL